LVIYNLFSLHFRVQAQGYTLNIQDQSVLIHKMLRAERLGEATRLTEEMLQNGIYPHVKILRDVVAKLSVAGNLDVLLRMEGLLSDVRFYSMYLDTRSLLIIVSSSNVTYPI